MGRKKRGEYDACQVREIAATAIVDPRTVARWQRGENVYGTTKMRIERALVALGRAVEGDNGLERALKTIRPARTRASR